MITSKITDIEPITNLNLHVFVESEVHCEQQMLMKFGKLVDLEVLQTLSGNRRQEEMRQEIREQEAKYIQELKHWEVYTPEMLRG